MKAFTARATMRPNNTRATVDCTSIVYPWRGGLQWHHVGWAECGPRAKPRGKKSRKTGRQGCGPSSGLMCWVNGKTAGNDRGEPHWGGGDQSIKKEGKGEGGRRGGPRARRGGGWVGSVVPGNRWSRGRTGAKSAEGTTGAVGGASRGGVGRGGMGAGKRGGGRNTKTPRRGGLKGREEPREGEGGAPGQPDPHGDVEDHEHKHPAA